MPSSTARAGRATLTSARTYLTGQSAAPELYGQMYFAANRRGDPLEPLRLEIDNLVFGALADHVHSLAPRAVIATHHLPLVVLGRARRKVPAEQRALDAPLLGVVTDYTAHACWAERGVDAWPVPSAARVASSPATASRAHASSRRGSPSAPRSRGHPRSARYRACSASSSRAAASATAR